jgi:DNA-3-methyladenine glycosylase I
MSMDRSELIRCAWAGSDPLMRAYHHHEWGVPQRDPRLLWEMLALEGFQAGLAWITVLRKREAFRAAFAGFDPRKVAHFGEADVARLMADPGIIRSQAKIAATIAGANVWCAMEDAGESFADWCWSFTDERVVVGDGKTLPAKTPLSETISNAMRKRGFQFVGPVIVYAWMQAIGIVNDHETHCFRRNVTSKRR